MRVGQQGGDPILAQPLLILPQETLCSLASVFPITEVGQEQLPLLVCQEADNERGIW